MTPHNRTPETIADLLARICRGEEDDFAVGRLTVLCIEMGTAHLCYLESTGRRVRETQSPVEFRQLACAGLSSLFVRELSGGYPRLKRIFTPLLERGASPEEWLMLLRRVITRRLQQQLGRIYHQRNPEGARLVRNICIAVQRMEEVTLRRDLDLILEFYPQTLPPNLPFTHPPRPLLQAAAQVFRPRMTVDELTHALLLRLASWIGSPIIVSVQELAELIAEYRSVVQREDELVEPSSDDDALLQCCLQAAERSLCVIQKALICKYVDKQKLSFPEAAALYTAVKETLLGRLHTDDPDALTFADALRRHWPELPEERYRRQIRPLLDYIVKVYRKEMRERLQGILMPAKHAEQTKKGKGI